MIRMKIMSRVKLAYAKARNGLTRKECGGARIARKVTLPPRGVYPTRVLRAVT
jgi:hypothetical protein